MRLVRMLVGTVVIVCVGALPALAQTTDTAEVTVDFQKGKATPGAEIYSGSYQFAPVSLGNYLARPVGEFALLHHSFGGGGYTDKLAMGGLVLSKANAPGKVTPFGEVLAGIITCCGDTALGVRYGGGIRYAYSPKIDFRARFSLITGFYDGFVDTGWGLGGGIVWKLNK